MSPVEKQTLSRRDLLLAQYDSSYEYLAERLRGIGDEEYLWEPVPGSWSVRRRGQAATPNAYGAGEWVLDFARPEPSPAPFSTIAWRLGHLVGGQRMRYDYTFGTKSLRADQLSFAGTAAEALRMLDESHQSWRRGLAGLTDDNLDTVGFSSYPQGLDPTLPFAAIFWWTNRELIHHAAEIGLLRDLWAWRGQTAAAG